MNLEYSNEDCENWKKNGMKLLGCIFFALINQSTLAYADDADANGARLTLCSYQLKGSGQQFIILHVTCHVV